MTNANHYREIAANLRNMAEQYKTPLFSLKTADGAAKQAARKALLDKAHDFEMAAGQASGMPKDDST